MDGFCRDGESMVPIGLRCWNDIARRFLRGKSAWFLLQMVTSLQSDGLRVEMSVGTGMLCYTM